MILISRKEVLRAMRAVDRFSNPVPFSLEVCTLNKSTDTGGDRLIINKAILYNKKSKSPGKASLSQISASKSAKIPNHDLHQTLNVLILPSNQIRTIHIRLIERFNNKTVYD